MNKKLQFEQARADCSTGADGFGRAHIALSSPLIREAIKVSKYFTSGLPSIFRVQFMFTCIFYCIFLFLSHSDFLWSWSWLREKKDWVWRGHAPIIMPEQPARVIRTTCWSNKWRTATGNLMGPKEQRFAAHECFVAFVRKTAPHSRPACSADWLGGDERKRVEKVNLYTKHRLSASARQ